MLPTFKLSLLSRHCLLAMATASLPSLAQAASPWTVTDGTTLTATSDYASRTAGDYPLFVSGDNSVLQTLIPLDFRTTGNNLFAANVLSGGTLSLDTATLVTTGQRSHGINVDNATAKINGGTISVSGNGSAGINADNGAMLDLTNLSVTADGDNGAGIALKDGVLNATDVNIFGSGSLGRGIDLSYGNVGNVQATLKDVNIVMRGGSAGGLMVGNATVVGNGVNISTTNKARGVEIYNPSAGHGTITLEDSNISTADGDAVYLLGGDITLNNATINTGSGVGINVNKDAHAEVNNSSVTTQEDNAAGMWIASSDTSANINNSDFTTYGSGSHAVNAQFGPATIANTSLITVGDGSYGLYSESQVTGDKLTIITEGETSIGVYGARGGDITLTNSSIFTKGDKAAALLAYPGSLISADNIIVDTQGQNAYALWAQAGTLNISNSQLDTQGDAAGLYVNNDASMNGSSVKLDNTILNSHQSSAVVSNGASLDLTLTNGSQLIGGNGTLIDSRAGAQQSIINLNADNNVLLKGDIVVSNDNVINTQLTRSSQLTGGIINGTGMSIDDSSRWLLTKDSTLKSLSTQGTVQFSDAEPGFKTLALDDLSGNGTFMMGTDIQALNGDLITVSGNSTGSHQLSIRNSGLEPVNGDDVLAVVKTAGNGDEQFSLQNGVVDAGTYQYGLEHQGNDWVLAQKSKDGDDKGTDPILTPSAATALGVFNALPSAWYGEMTTLRTRLGDVRQGKQEGGAWVRGVGGEFKMHDANGDGYSQNQSGISVGADSAIEVGDAQMLLGVFSGYSRSNLTFTRNSTGTIDSFFIGAYTTFLLSDGWFLDNVIKANNFSSHTNARMSDGKLASGGYSTPALGASVELGKRIDFDNGWFAEPSAQISAVWIKGADYALDNGLQANSDVATSRQGALHAVVGKTITLQNGVTIQPWARASLIEEFANSNQVSINNHSFNNDLSGLRGEYTLGAAAQITQDVQLYSEASYSKGSKTETPWNASLGVRWSW